MFRNADFFISVALFYFELNLKLIGQNYSLADISWSGNMQDVICFKINSNVPSNLTSCHF